MPDLTQPAGLTPPARQNDDAALPAPARMPFFPGQDDFPAINPSIRDRLEYDAWTRHTRFSEQFAKRRPARRRERRALRWQDRVLLVLGITLLSLVLLRIETAHAAQHEWGLWLDDGQSHRLALALDTDIKVEVTGLVARVWVEQRFENNGAHWAEGVYRFPLPADAAVDRMQIEVGDRIIEGEIQERVSARRVYQQARQAGQTASLVEQQAPNQFETRLANIGPGESITVRIGFLGPVSYADHGFSLRIPMTFTPRGGPTDLPVDGTAMHPTAVPVPTMMSATASNHHRLSLEVRLVGDHALASIESRYHDVDILPEPDGYRVVLARFDERTDRDFELAWYPDFQATPTASLTRFDNGDASYVQLMLIPPLPGNLAPRPREVIFIIDTSGSMDGQSIEQARAALLQGLDQLGAHDAFNLIQFNSETELLFPASVPADAPHLAQAAAWIEGLVANGGTVMAPALHAAMSQRGRPDLLRQVVFMTDGAVNNPQQMLQDIGLLLGESRLFTVSIGSAPNAWFMRKAAEIGRGSHTHVGKLDEVAERMTALWSSIRTPALSDIEVDLGTRAEAYPELIPDLYAGEPLWVIARMPLSPGRIRITGVFDGQPWEHELELPETAGSDTLATLWGRQKIKSLQEGLLFGGDREWIEEQVLRVALDFGLLTSRTAMVAVDRTPARPLGDDLATGSVPSLLPAGSAREIAFPQTASGWKMQLLLSLVTLLLATWMYRAALRAGTTAPASTGPRLPLRRSSGPASDAAG